MKTKTQATILLVEDDPGHARLIQKNLRRQGINGAIVHVTDGQAAVDYLRCQGPYAAQTLPESLLILLDLNLPILNGAQVLEHISAVPNLKDLPRIIITTSDEPEDMRSCAHFGYDDYVLKPLDYVDLAQKLEHLL